MKNRRFFLPVVGNRPFSPFSPVQFRCGHRSRSDGPKNVDDWLFRLGDDTTARMPAFDDSGWRRLTLPHDWSVEAPLSPSLASCTGYLPGGIAWYRKHFAVTDSAARHYIYFEGVYNRSEVYLNGHLLGCRPNGYVSFLYDMTPLPAAGRQCIGRAGGSQPLCRFAVVYRFGHLPRRLDRVGPPRYTSRSGVQPVVWSR